MALNQIERAILIAARLYVADGREPRICHAISRSAELVGLGRTTNQVEKVREAATRLRRLIIGEIKVGGEPVFSLEDWICDKLPGCGARINQERMRTTRLAWIDWLLDEPWTEHNGGPQPLLDGEMVIIRKRNGEESGPRPANAVRWEHAAAVPALYSEWVTQYDCVAYKVIYEAPTC
jgi:hypothetical protein